MNASEYNVHLYRARELIDIHGHILTAPDHIGAYIKNEILDVIYSKETAECIRIVHWANHWMIKILEIIDNYKGG